MSGRASQLRQPACVQVITRARHPETGEVRTFPTPCDVPDGWVKTGPTSGGGNHSVLENLVIAIREDVKRLPGAQVSDVRQVLETTTETFRRLRDRGASPQEAATKTRRLVDEAIEQAGGGAFTAGSGLSKTLKFGIPLALFIGGSIALSKYS